jgi:hypothetical protein
MRSLPSLIALKARVNKVDISPIVPPERARSSRGAAGSLRSSTSVAAAPARTDWRAADRLDGVKRVMRAGRDDRDLVLIAHILDDVEEMPLLQEWTREHVMDLADNEHLC